MIQEETKECCCCNLILPKTKEYFGFLKKSKDGFRRECKKCRNAKMRNEYRSNPEKFKNRKNKWKKKNPESYKKSTRKYYENNLDKIKKYSQKNKIRIRQNHSRWVLKNKEKEYARLYKLHRKRYKENLTFRLRCNISNAINAYLRKFKGDKSNNSFLQKLPYTIRQLRDHLESQFDDKMTWSNYGSYWWIDHIIPQSKLPYDSMDCPNFIKSWSLENLRPLEKIQNIKKGNKLI